MTVAAVAPPVSDRRPPARRILGPAPGVGSSGARAPCSGWWSWCCSSLVAILAPLISPYDPIATSFTQVRKPPSWAHWLGTDEVGRGRAGPHHLGRPRLTQCRSRLRGHRTRHRRAARPAGGLCRRLDRRSAVAHRRRDAGHSVPDPGDRAGRLPRTEPEQCDDRHRRHRHACFHQADPRPDDRREGRGLCRGGARGRQSALAHRAAPRAAQHRAAAAGAGLARHRRRDHRRGRPVVPGPRPAAALALVGAAC